MQAPQHPSSFWAQPFRPMFLLVALQAPLSILYWLGGWFGTWPLPAIGGNPLAWHAHEMVFGFAGAAIAGFVLTAVANWTARPAVSGVPLMLLAGLWLAARVAAWVPGALPLFAAADLAYGTLLVVLVGRELLAVGNRRNYKVLLAIGAWLACNIWFFQAAVTDPLTSALPAVAGLWVLVILLNIIGGRIIPAFTGNWLRLRAGPGGDAGALPAAFGRLDAAAIAATVLYAVSWVAGFTGPLVGALGLVAAALQAVRLARWQGQRTGSDALVWVLHVGFAWVPIGLALLALADFGLLRASAGLHALGGGAVATLILAVSSRAAFGHSGRPLHAPPALAACFWGIGIAAVLRVAAAAGLSWTPLLVLAGAAWLLAFGLYAWVFVPILLKRL